MRLPVILVTAILLVAIPTAGRSQAPAPPGTQFLTAPMQIMQSQGFAQQSSTVEAPLIDNSPCGVRYVQPGYRYGTGLRYVGSDYGYGYGYGYPNYGYGYPNYGSGYDYTSTYNNGYQSGYSQGQYTTSLEYENQILQSQVNALQQLKRGKGAAAPAPNGAAANGAPIDPAVAQRQKGIAQRAETAVRSGRRLFEKGSYAAAADRFEQAAELDPADGASFFYSAQAYLAAEKYDKASAAIAKGLSFNPKWPTKPTDVRAMYGDNNKLLQQMGGIARRLKANPQDKDALFLLGFQLFSSGEKEKARTIFEKLAKQAPGDDRIRPFIEYYHQNGQSVPAPPPPGPSSAERGPIPVPDLEEQPVQFAGNHAAERP